MARFIARRERELHAACAVLGGCAFGDAKATPGFRLRAWWTTMPWARFTRMVSHGEPGLLASCYRRILAVADELGARSIAIPAISTGSYGYPKLAAAQIAVATLRSQATRVEVARLVAFDEETARIYRAVVEGRP